MGVSAEKSTRRRLSLQNPERAAGSSLEARPFLMDLDAGQGLRGGSQAPRSRAPVTRAPLGFAARIWRRRRASRTHLGLAELTFQHILSFFTDGTIIFAFSYIYLSCIYEIRSHLYYLLINPTVLSTVPETIRVPSLPVPGLLFLFIAGKALVFCFSYITLYFMCLVLCVINQDWVR